MRKNEGQIARYRILERRDQVVAAHALFRRSPASPEIAEGLHHDPVSAEHVGELRDLLAVFDRRPEGLRKVLGDEQREVRIVRLVLLTLIGVTVYHRQMIVIVLRGDFSGRIRAEGAHLVVEGGGIVDQLCLVEILIEELHDLVPDFYAHADIHGSRLRLDAELLALSVQPVRAVSSDRYDHLGSVELFALFCENTADLLVFSDQDLLHRAVEAHVDAGVRQMLLELLIDLVPFFRSQMADRTFHELEVGADRLGADLSDLLFLADAVDIGVRSELEIDLI